MALSLTPRPARGREGAAEACPPGGMGAPFQAEAPHLLSELPSVGGSAPTPHAGEASLGDRWPHVCVLPPGPGSQMGKDRPLWQVLMAKIEREVFSDDAESQKPKLSALHTEDTASGLPAASPTAPALGPCQRRRARSLATGHQSSALPWGDPLAQVKGSVPSTTVSVSPTPALGKARTPREQGGPPYHRSS